MNDAPYTSSRQKFATLSDTEIDRLFYLTPIYEALFDTIRSTANQSWRAKEQTFLDADSNERAEWLFASRMVASYGTSRQEVDHILNSVPPALQLDELTDARNDLIMRLAGTEAGKHWMKCVKMDDGWKYVAHFVYGGHSRLSNDDVDLFLQMLDQIAIMHDMIKGRGRKYGFDFTPIKDESVEVIKQYCHTPEKAREILKLLHEHIDKQTTPKRASRPVRAMMEAGALTERLPWEIYEKEFGSDNNNKSSYNDYTNTDKENPFDDDILFKEMKESFKKLS